MLGIPGSGKSAFAEHFADTFQAPILNSTKLQKELGISAKNIEALRGAILSEYLKTRRTILIEGGVDRKTKRTDLIRGLTKAGYQPLIVWVQTDSVEARRRATKPYPDGSGLSNKEFDSAVDAFQPPVAQEKALVISGKHTYATQLKIVLRQIASSVDRTPDTPPSSLSGRPRGRGAVLR
jgi:predicted kinase